MAPALPDHDVLRNKLRVITDSLDVLSGLEELDEQRLRDDPILAAAVERLIARVVDQAVDINNHLCAVLLGRSAGEYRESFRLVADAGIVPLPLADQLMQSVAMRNVIVHGYLQLDLGLVAAAVPLALAQYRSYVSAVAAWLVDHPTSAE